MFVSPSVLVLIGILLGSFLTVTIIVIIALSYKDKLDDKSENKDVVENEKQ